MNAPWPAPDCTTTECLTEYRPRRPQEGVVYQVVHDHYETFRAEAVARRDGEPLPRFIDQEFRGFLRCGQLAGRVRQVPSPGSRVVPLHAGVLVPGQDRARLERVCRYALRPPPAADRVQYADDGDIILALRHSCHLRALRFGVQGADGTTHLRFDPIELLERLAALTRRCSSGRSRASSRDHPAPADQSGAVLRGARGAQRDPAHPRASGTADGGPGRAATESAAARVR
jgi:hypothetical protein